MIGFFLIGVLAGYNLGSSKIGRLAENTNALPDALFTVIKIDETSTELCQRSLSFERFLVDTNVFGGMTIVKGDVVRKAVSDQERKDRDIPEMAYLPLVRVDD